MDSALKELISEGSPRDEVEAILRLQDGETRVPPQAREVTAFGQIRTVRIRRGDIVRVWADPRTASLKAARTIAVERDENMVRQLFGSKSPASSRISQRRPEGLRETGKGVVLGVIDWGFDFAHPAFLDSRGRSRVLALWDQRDPLVMPDKSSVPPQPWGYGRVFGRAEINNALATARPYKHLGYHPGDADHGRGAHGTHVADIAGGSLRPGAPGGMAPEAELVFVHLAADKLGGLADLGNSVRIVEAVDFISQVAGDRPVAINMSLGRQGGAKSGQSLVERALDAFGAERPGGCIVQSAGNYFLNGCHASGILRPGGVRTLTWKIRARDRTENEMEIWYSDRDRLRVTLVSPDGRRRITARLGETRNLRDGAGQEIARIYSRAFEPNTQCHNCDIFVRRDAPGGDWKVRVEGEQIVDGRFDAWIERDPGGRRNQSRFAPEDIDTGATIGSIASGFHSIAVGAAQVDRRRGLIPARFASSGPTRDGRMKPDVVADGVRVLAARSAWPEAQRAQGRTTRMSGASQAAPLVAGLAALCLEAGQGGLSLHDIRRAVIGTARRPPGLRLDHRLRLGAGIVDPAGAVAMARRLAKSLVPLTRKEPFQ